METMQVLNDGANEGDFKQLLEILKSFGQVEVLYDPSDPKDNKVPTEQNKHLPCVTDKVYEITLYLMFNREFMNDVYRTFRIISRGL